MFKSTDKWNVNGAGPDVLNSRVPTHAVWKIHNSYYYLEARLKPKAVFHVRYTFVPV